MRGVAFLLSAYAVSLRISMRALFVSFGLFFSIEFACVINLGRDWQSPPAALATLYTGMKRSNAGKHLSTLEANLHAHEKELKATREKAKSLRKKEARLRKSIFDVCFILYVWCVPSGLLALAYSAHAGHLRNYDANVSMEELEEQFLRTDMAVLTAISSRVGGRSKRALEEASRFEGEHRLFQWIQNENNAKGLAPNTSMVRQHLAAQRVEPVATSVQRSAMAGKVKSVSWVQRFRKRWALKRGSFMPGERMSQEVIGEKVTCSNLLKPHLGFANSPLRDERLWKKGGRWAAPKQGPQ